MPKRKTLLSASSRFRIWQTKNCILLFSSVPCKWKINRNAEEWIILRLQLRALCALPYTNSHQVPENPCICSMNNSLYKESMEVIRNSCLLDDFAFQRGLEGYNDGAEYLIQKILGRNDIRVEKVEAQHRIRNLYGHDAVLDILATDEKGKKINIEMQRIRGNAESILIRMQFYMSLVFSSSLGKNKSYNEAKETIIIFIVDKDIINENMPVYKYTYRDEKGKIMKHSLCTLVVANLACNGKMDEELGTIYKDIAERDYGSMKNEMMKSIIRRVKGSEIIMGETYSKFDEIMEKYAAISRQEEKEQIVKNLISMGVLSDNDIALATGMPVTEVSKIANAVKQ